MRAALSVVLGLAVALVVAAHVSAADKEVTLKGTITCAKCDLKVAKKCETVIKAKEGDKEVVYYFDAKSHKDNHGQICQGGKEGSVTGTVKEEKGKKVITPKKDGVKFD